MNKCFFTGNLTKDVELRTTTSGISVASFSIAVNRQFKDKDGNRPVDFINIVAWKGLAENVAKYCSKGKKVAVVGEMQNRSYDAQDGTKRYVTEILASDIEFLSPKTEQTAPSEPDLSGFAPIQNEQLPF